MTLYALGLNHATAPLAVRERVAFPPDALGDALRDLAARAGGEGSGDPVDLQSHRGLCPRAASPSRSSNGSRISTTCRSDSLAPLPLHAAARPGGDARVPRRSAGSTRWCWASRRSSAR